MAITVTATAGGVTANGLGMSSRVLSGTGGTGATATQTGAAAHEATITTTVTSGRCYMAAVDFANTAFTADANTSGINDFADATNLRHYGSFRASVSTGTPGALVQGCTAPTDNGGLAVAEILPFVSGTPTVDTATNFGGISSTAATTLTSAAFTPTPGALIVVMVSANGGAGVTTMAVSDSSGLIWTEVVKSNASGAGYAGVWVATAPAGSAPVQPQPGGKVWRRRHRRRQTAMQPGPTPLEGWGRPA